MSAYLVTPVATTGRIYVHRTDRRRQHIGESDGEYRDNEHAVSSGFLVGTTCPVRSAEVAIIVATPSRTGGRQTGRRRRLLGVLLYVALHSGLK